MEQALTQANFLESYELNVQHAYLIAIRETILRQGIEIALTRFETSKRQEWSLA
jgi:hypothetical protein